MANSSVHNFDSLINRQEDLVMDIAKAKSIISLLLNQNFREYSIPNLYLCLDVLDDLLNQAGKSAEQCETFLRGSKKCL